MIFTALPQAHFPSIARPSRARSARMSTYSYDVGEVNQEGLDRDLELPPSTLFRLFQSARMRLPWIGAAYEGFRAEQPVDPLRRLVVKSQGLLLTDTGLVTSPLRRTVRTAVRLAEVGKTSVELLYDVFFGDVLVARGCAVMVSVTGPPGGLRPTQVPRRVADLVMTTASPSLPSSPGAVHRLATKAELALALQHMSVPKTPAAPAGAALPSSEPLTFETTFVVRFSDEDANKHANHTFLIRLVEDTLAIARATAALGSGGGGGGKGDEEEEEEEEAAAGGLSKFATYSKLAGIAMEYLREAHAMDVVRVRVATEQQQRQQPRARDGDSKSERREIQLAVEVSKTTPCHGSGAAAVAAAATAAAATMGEEEVTVARGVVILTRPPEAVDQSRL
jgi:acyl-CoA thioesterase FadM